MRSGSEVSETLRIAGGHEHDDHLGERADAGRERLAEDQRRAQGGGDEQLGEHAGVAFADDRWQPP
jgi:hypothetical protein